MGELIDRLKEYSMTDIYPMHMPGHKRNLNYEINPFKMDITEIEGFDDLHEAEGILMRLKKYISYTYSAQESYILVNGSTSGILAAISCVVRKKEKILVARNCHKSVYNGIFLAGAETDYIYPHIDKKTGINGRISPEEVDNKLAKNPEIKAVLITSPTYEGVISNVEEIAKIAHKHKIPLIVDAAHGAHMGFFDEKIKNPVNLGADITIMSTHKTLPSVTQTGIMCINSDLIEKDRLKKYYDIYTTSSPSYLMMSSVEYCMDFLNNSSDKFYKYKNLLNEFYENCKIKKLEFFKSDDLCKIVISTAKTNINGEELKKLLREEYKIELEMSSKEYAIAMTSVCDSEEGFSRLSKALMSIDKTLSYVEKNSTFKPIIAKKKCSISEADEKKGELIELKSGINKVCKDFIFAYPPGIPIIAPGEIITSDIVDFINSSIENGLNIVGLTKDGKVNVWQNYM